MVGLHEELVGKVRLVGVDHDRLGQVLQDLDDGVVVLAIPTLFRVCETFPRLRESHILMCLVSNRRFLQPMTN